MQLYQLKSKQVFPISKKEAWDFLSDPKNLAVITPQHMGFHILAGADRPMFQGQIIQYIVKPFPFISTKWVTEITHVKDGEYLTLTCNVVEITLTPAPLHKADTSTVVPLL